jgi:hypothetical protein
MNWYKIANNNYFFVTDCVHSTAEDIDCMVDSGKEVTFDEFIFHVDDEELRKIERSLGYPAGKETQRLNDDYYVSFWHGKYKGVDAYYFIHSSIEYVFTLGGVESVNDLEDNMVPGRYRAPEGPGGKYPLEIYKAYNDVYGSNYTAPEIDELDFSEIRSTASMGLSGGRDEFDMLMKRHTNELV